jgi:hypothetical protein
VLPLSFSRGRLCFTVLRWFFTIKIAFKESSFHLLCQCFLTMPAINKHFDAGARRTAIELWRAKVPQKDIMKQLGMFTATLMRVLAFAIAIVTICRSWWPPCLGVWLRSLRRMGRLPITSLYTFMMIKLLFCNKSSFLIFFRDLSFYVVDCTIRIIVNHIYCKNNIEKYNQKKSLTLSS